MKVSFNGNHLLQFRNSKVRNGVYSMYKENLNPYTTKIFKCENTDSKFSSDLLIIDGKDKEDFDSLLALNNKSKKVVACLERDLVESYAKSAKKVNATYLFTL